MKKYNDYDEIFNELEDSFKIFDVQSLGSELLVTVRDINNKRYNLKISDFYPYFYIPKNKLTYHKPFIEINKTKKIKCNHPAEVKKEREKYKYTYEADILYDYRFNFDIVNKYNESLDVTPRIWFFDIEVFMNYSKVFPKPSDNNNFINSISIYDNYDNKYITIVVIPDTYKNKFKKEVIKDKNNIIIKVNTERELLEIFIKLLRNIQPDIISGWNILLFDIPFIVEKIKYFYKDLYNKLSIFNVEPRQHLNRIYNTNEYEIPGIVVLDYQILYEKFGETLPRYSLEVVSQHELNKGKIKYENTLDYIYENEFETFLKYNIEDVKLVKEIDEQVSFINLVLSLSTITYCKLYSFNFGNTLKIGDMILMKYLRKSRDVEYVMKSKSNTQYNSSYRGAIVKEPEIGLYYDYIIDFDASSMYPSIIRSLNISPDTFLCRIYEDETFISNDLRKYLLNKDNNEFDLKEVNVIFENEVVSKYKLKKIKDWLYKKCNGNNFTIALNGSIFNNSFDGILKYIEDDLSILRNKTKFISKFFGKLQNIF